MIILLVKGLNILLRKKFLGEDNKFSINFIYFFLNYVYLFRRKIVLLIKCKVRQLFTQISLYHEPVDSS